MNTQPAMNTQLAIRLLTCIRDNFVHGRKAGSPIKEPVLFICWELLHVQFEMQQQGFDDANADLSKTAETLSDYVRNALVDTRGLSQASLGGWVRATAQPNGLLNGGGSDLCRLAWVDRMLHELETKGCLP